MHTQTFSVPLELKASEEAEGEFEGLASVFDKADSFGDIILKGAFQKSLKTRPAGKVKMLRQHDQRSLVGTWTEIRENSEGLFVKGQLLLGIQEAAESQILLKAGILDSLSIGFRTVKDESIPGTKDDPWPGRKISELELLEISLVAIPAQAGALITSVKAADITTRRDLEQVLREAGLSRSTSKYICAGWNPPAQRDVEGEETVGVEQEIVGDIRSLIETMQGN